MLARGSAAVRVLTEQPGRQLAPEIAHMAGQLRKPEVHETVQLPHPVPEVLPQPVAEPNETRAVLPSLDRAADCNGQSPPSRRGRRWAPPAARAAWSTLGVFGERRGLEEDSIGLIDHRDDVSLRRDIDAHEAHSHLF